MTTGSTPLGDFPTLLAIPNAGGSPAPTQLVAESFLQTLSQQLLEHANQMPAAPVSAVPQALQASQVLETLPTEVQAATFAVAPALAASVAHSGEATAESDEPEAVTADPYIGLAALLLLPNHFEAAEVAASLGEGNASDAVALVGASLNAQHAGSAQDVTADVLLEDLATTDVTTDTGDVLPSALSLEAVAAPRHAPAAGSGWERPVHAPVGSVAWSDEIAARVSTLVEQGRHTASLRLSPEHLGPLEVRISVSDGAASVWFGAAHADTRAAIEQALPKLRELFESQGMSLTDAGVFHDPPRQQPHPSATAAYGEVPGDDETVTMQVRRGLVDAYA